MKRTLALVVAAVLCLTLLLSGCSETYETKNDKALNETIVATIQGVDISQADYNIVYYSAFNQMSQYAQFYGEGWLDQTMGEDGKTMGDMIKENAFNQCSQLIAIELLANDLKVDLDDIDDLVEKDKEELLANYGGSEGYITMLESMRTTDKAVETSLRRSNIYSKVYAKITAEGGAAYIKDEDIVKEFSESYMSVQHILIQTQADGSVDENGNPVAGRSDEEALTIANEVIGKIASGEDFDKLIEEYNEDPGMTAGNFYTFTDGTMVAEFEEAAKNLKVGEYTAEAVKTDYGYHIIKKYDVKTDNDEFTNFKETKSAEKINEVIEKKVKTLKVTKKDDVVNKYISEWVKVLNQELMDMMAQSGQAPMATDPSATVETVPAEGGEVVVEGEAPVEGEAAPAEGEVAPAPAE